MPIKELAVATVILVICFGLLYMAHNNPNPVSDDLLAANPFVDGFDQPAAPPAERPVPPPQTFDDPLSNETSWDELGLGQLDPLESESDLLIEEPSNTVTIPEPDQGGQNDDLIARVADFDFDADPIASPQPTQQLAQQPVAQPVDTASSQRGGGVHVVASGETLMDISFTHYGTHQQWSKIARANDVDPNDLRVGQKLNIPAIDNVVTAASHGRVTDGNTYVVKSGDMLYTIARDVLGDASRHKELEALNDVDPNNLRAGMVLKLPAGPRLAETGTTTPRAAGDTPRRLPDNGRWHVVQRGEILGQISMEYYGTSKRWREIADANGMSDPSELRAGQRLIIPGNGSGNASANGGEAPSSSAGARTGSGTYHVVARGEVLSQISTQYYGTSTRWKEIVAANPGINPNRLLVGSRLLIPGTASTGSQAPTRSPALAPIPSARERETFSWPERNDLPALPPASSETDPFRGL